MTRSKPPLLQSARSHPFHVQTPSPSPLADLGARVTMATATASNRNPTDRNADATVHIAQLDDKVSDAVLWELMIQAGPVRHVYVPRDRITGNHYGYGFCEFRTPLDAQYATKVLNMVKLYSKPIRISQSTIDRRSQDVGANLFIGNLVDEVDEKLLHDAFSAFGTIIDTPYIMRDPLTNESKRYGFVKYGSFEHSDAAIAAMDGQYICNSPITVQYAFKKDGHSRERHGSQAERILAAKAAEARRIANQDRTLRPHTIFSDRPASAKRPRLPAPAPVPPSPGMPDVPVQAVAPQLIYSYSHPHPYAPPGMHTIQWQGNTTTRQYSPAPLPYPYQAEGSVPPTYVGYQGHQAQAVAQLGWTANRQIRADAGAANGTYRQQSPPYGDPSVRPQQNSRANNNTFVGVPRPVLDENAPPPP